MAQLWYDVIPHQGGWVIVLMPGRSEAFPTKKAAFDAAAEYAHKLHFVGYAMQVRIEPKRETSRDQSSDPARSRRARAS
jgi:hypothetical protein